MSFDDSTVWQHENYGEREENCGVFFYKKTYTLAMGAPSKQRLAMAAPSYGGPTPSSDPTCL